MTGAVGDPYAGTFLVVVVVAMICSVARVAADSPCTLLFNEMCEATAVLCFLIGIAFAYSFIAELGPFLVRGRLPYTFAIKDDHDQQNAKKQS